MKRKDGLTLLAERDGLKLYSYKPTVLRPMLKEFAPMLKNRRLRLLRNYFRPGKYTVYYLGTGEDLIGMCVVTPGGPGLKLKCNRDDIVLGPDYIRPEYRGKGYARNLMKWVMEMHTGYRHVYGLISNDNIPSQKSAMAAGLQPYQYIRLRGPLRVHEICSKDVSTHTIYRSV